MTRLVDLSMPVHRDMITFPQIPPPTLLMYESWTEFAERIGAATQGANWLTASYLIIQDDHVGTHCDAIKHIRGPVEEGQTTNANLSDYNIPVASDLPESFSHDLVERQEADIHG